MTRDTLVLLICMIVMFLGVAGMIGVLLNAIHRVETKVESARIGRGT